MKKSTVILLVLFVIAASSLRTKEKNPMIKATNETRDSLVHNLPFKKIMYDDKNNIIGIVITTSNKGTSVLLDEPRIIELSKKTIDSLKISKEEYLNYLRKGLMGGQGNPKMMGERCWHCWTQLCNNPTHDQGCGWEACAWVPCGAPDRLARDGRRY